MRRERIFPSHRNEGITSPSPNDFLVSWRIAIKAIVVICDPNRIDQNLMSSLQQLFPECDIKIVFTEKGDAEMYPIALTLKKARS